MTEKSTKYQFASQLQQVCLRQNIPFVSYRLPLDNEIITLVQYQSPPTKLASLQNIDQLSGFLIAPFDDNERHGVQINSNININKITQPIIATKAIPVQPINNNNSTAIQQNTTKNTDITAANNNQSPEIQPLPAATNKLSGKVKNDKNNLPELNRSSAETGTANKRTTATNPDNT